MSLSESFLARCFDRGNPPALDLMARSNTLSIKAINALAREIPGGVEESRGRVALGLLLLWHDHWDESHHIAQSDEGEADHDFLHAIIHRREKDFANSAYWFRAAGRNASFDLIATRARNLLLEKNADAAFIESMIPGDQWNASGFLASVKKKNPEPLLRALQAEEIIAFFETMAA